MKHFLSFLCIVLGFSSSYIYESPKKMLEVDYKTTHVSMYSELNVCFRFKYRSDSYDPVTMTISEENCVVKLSKVTGPTLCTAEIPVGVIAADRDCLIDESLFHEILHYDHITLRKEKFDDISLIGWLLIISGFHHAYVGMLSSL